MHGVVSLSHFSDAAVREPAVRALMTKVHASPDPNASEASDHFYARVRVTTKKGEAFERFVERPLGRDRAHPLPAGALEGKFRDCARLALDADSTERLVNLCAELDSVSEMADVIDRIAAGATASPNVEPLDAHRGRFYA
jgi:2-methylcitrate dehydratase PrpD